jgi:hypothetical protein
VNGMQDARAASRIGNAERLVWIVLVSGLAVAAIVDSAYKPLSHDTAWYLRATGHWLAGESL